MSWRWTFDWANCLGHGHRPGGCALRIHTTNTAAPIVVDGLVIQGSRDVRIGDCFVTALDTARAGSSGRPETIARTGTRDVATWAGLPDHQRFGGSVWKPGSYDSATDLIYFGVLADL